MSLSPAVTRDLRVLFRHMRSLPTFQSQASPLRKTVLEKLRTGSFCYSDEKSLRECARSYALMTLSMKELNYLRELDTGEKLDPRDKIQATARRVGLSVPSVSDHIVHIVSPNVAMICEILTIVFIVQIRA